MNLVVTDIHGRPHQDECALHAALGASAVRIDIAELMSMRRDSEAVYAALLNGGWDRAAARLAGEWPRVSVAAGYSAGGTLLWQAVRAGMKADALICVSSTRLRFEVPEAIRVPTLVLTGERDPCAPSLKWASRSSVRHISMEGCEHDFYRNPARIQVIIDHVANFVTSRCRSPSPHC
jgi:dienelactone hydrolase